jgi:hypothetical protein
MEAVKTNPEQIQDFMERHQLDWLVKKEPLSIVTEVCTPLYVLEDLDIEDTQFFATVRQDNRKKFAAVSSGYEVFQNYELTELIYQVAHGLGLTVSKAGYFDGGKRVFIQISNDNKKVANDIVETYIVGINSFDGSTALRWGGSNYTISCSNSFWGVYKGLNNSVRHTTNMRAVIDESLRVAEKIKEADASMFETFARFASTEIDSGHIQALVQSITKIDIADKVWDQQRLHSPQAIDKARDLSVSIIEETANKGQTLWGLWSGVTHWSSHKAGTDKNRDKSKALGSLQKVDNQAFELLKSFIS